jgi:hypothetical protein
LSQVFGASASAAAGLQRAKRSCGFYHKYLNEGKGMTPVDERVVQSKSFSLGAFWSQIVSQASQFNLEVNLTSKQRGQLKMLADKLGSDTREVILFAVHEWKTFAQRAQLDGGLSCFPYEPNIGFLLAHYPALKS